MPITRRTFIHRLIGAPIGAALSVDLANSQTERNRQAVLTQHQQNKPENEINQAGANEEAKTKTEPETKASLRDDLHKVGMEGRKTEATAAAGGALAGAAIGGLIDYAHNAANQDPLTLTKDSNS